MFDIVSCNIYLGRSVWTNPLFESFQCVFNICTADWNVLSWPCVFWVPQGASPCAVVAVTRAEVGGCGYETMLRTGCCELQARYETCEARRGMASVRVAVWLTNSGQAVSSVAESVMLSTLSVRVKISPRLNNSHQAFPTHTTTQSFSKWPHEHGHIYILTLDHILILL